MTATSSNLLGDWEVVIFFTMRNNYDSIKYGCG
jgi:hypothetical protein